MMTLFLMGSVAGIGLSEVKADADIADALSKKHANSLDHDGPTQDTVIAGKTTLSVVKADTDVASAISLKHANSLDHSNSLDHNGGTQDTAISGKEPANANIQTHVTSAHAPSNAQKNSDITKAEMEAKLTGELSSHSHAGGSGDMAKAVYDPDADGDIAEAQLQLNYPTHSNANDHAHNTDTDLDSTFKASLKNTDNHTNGSTNKVYMATEQTKLAGIQAGAQVNNISDVNATDLTDGGQTALPTPAGGGGDGAVAVVATQDTANATTTLANATGLTFDALANSTYIIEVFLLWASSATTVGIKVSATASGSPIVQAGHFIAEAATGTPDSSGWNANEVGITTSASPFTTSCLGMVHAILKTGASASTWQLRFASETTGTISVKTGSTLRYRKVA